jgi:hypothetical protein
VPIAKVAAASLVPGLGQAVIGRRRRALGVAAGTVLLGVTGLYLRGVADDRYDEYHRALTIDQASLKYDRAMEFRRASAGAYAVAGAIWALAGVDAVRAERAHRRDVARTTDDRVALRLLPAATSGGVTMGVALAW